MSEFTDMKALRISKTDQRALARVARAIAGGNQSKALRQLVRQADEALEESGQYARLEAARNSPEAKSVEAKLLALFAQADAERGTESTAKSTAGADESAAFAAKWGNAGPSDPATKSAGGPADTPGGYAGRYGNK